VSRPLGLPRAGEVATLMLITLLAAGLRFYRLQDLPPGLHHDEASKAVTGRGLLQGDQPRLFFEENMGEEPLAMYLVAGALALAGEEPWVVRLPSALVGTLTVPLLWWLGRELLSEAGTKTPDAGWEKGQRPAGRAPLQAQVLGLGCALVLAILYWHVSFSRIGMQPILVPFFVTLAIAALVRGLNAGGRLWPWALAGLALGGSLYTYKAGYFVPPLAIVFLVYLAATERGLMRQHGRGLLLAAVVTLVVAAPITVYFATHPASFLQRPESVAVIGEAEGAAGLWRGLVANLPRVLGMFFLQGDANPRSNLPGRPALDPFLTVLFLAGLAWSLLGLRRARRALPLLWLVMMALPTLITEDAPHFGRAIGATPAIALLCGMGLIGIQDWATRIGKGWQRSSWCAVFLLILVFAGLAFSAVSVARAYFVTWGASPDLFYAYDVGLVEVSRYLEGVPDEEGAYLTPTPGDHYTLQYLVQRPLATFDGRAGRVYPPPGRAATVMVLLREDAVTLPALRATRPDGAVVWRLEDGYGEPYAAAYHLPARPDPAPLPSNPVGVRFGDAVWLVGYDLQAGADPRAVSRSETVHLVLYWQALAPLSADYTVFAHLLGEQNPASGGPLWAGHDSQPAGGSYPTTAWEPGEVVLDRHLLALPPEAVPGEYQLEAGLYLLATLERLPAEDATGTPLVDDAALLGSIRVEDRLEGENDEP
jgi:4-amino-4-deoxy-L-arabinose transferase-like glycosyltransferase